MTALASRLRGLFKLARSRHSPQSTTLPNGLHVEASCRLPRFRLWRETGEWKPGTAAETEGRVCAEHLGWQNCRLSWKGRYLVVEDGGGLLVTRPDWKARALAALPSIEDAEFTAPDLAHIIRNFENPEHQAIRKADQTAQPRTLHWLAAVRQWEKDNPGCSASNMRRLCELLTVEGVLETRLDKRGWYERRFYSVKGGAE